MTTLRTVANPAVVAALATRLERLTRDQGRIWGTITAHQMAAHLADVNEAVLQRRAFSMPPRPTSGVVKMVALYVPVPWPRDIKSGADPGSKSLPSDGFDADRLRAASTLEEIAGSSADALVARHPIFGPMTRANWHRWAFLHFDHHLRQFGL